MTESPFVPPISLAITTGSGRPAPEPGLLCPWTRWLSFPRVSVFSLRGEMLAACRAPIIGAVDNSAADTAVNWASYFVVQVTSLPPVVPSRRPRLAHANVSYKRAALELTTIDEDMGGLDALDQIDLGNQNGSLRIDPRPIVRHDQSHSLPEFVGQHFHAGRTFGGFVRHRGGRRYALRLAMLPALPTLRLLRSALVGLLAGTGDSPLYVEG